MLLQYEHVHVNTLKFMHCVSGALIGVLNIYCNSCMKLLHPLNVSEMHDPRGMCKHDPRGMTLEACVSNFCALLSEHAHKFRFAWVCYMYSGNRDR